MTIKRQIKKAPLQNTHGAAPFFNIVMAVILIITVIVLFFILKEVLKEEKVQMTIFVADTGNEPITGAQIFIDDKREAVTDSNGIYAYSYSVNRQGETIEIRVEKTGFEEGLETRTLGINPVTVPIIMLRPFAAVTIMAVDSSSNKPLKGIEVYIDSDKIGETDAKGEFKAPADKYRLNQSIFVQLRSKYYATKPGDVLIDALDYSETFALTRKVSRPRRPKKQPLPSVATVFEKPLEFESPEPPLPEPGEAIGINPIMVDSGWYYFDNGNWRKALRIYMQLTGERRWYAHPAFWLYSADCALHLAGDQYGRYNSALLDSALDFIQKAERYQNRIKEDLFPALVQIKHGETYAYLHETQKNKNFKKAEEFRKRAVKLLTEGINQLQNKKLTNTDLYKFALNLRNDVGDF
jgi:hypothetical protein